MIKDKVSIALQEQREQDPFEPYPKLKEIDPKIYRMVGLICQKYGLTFTKMNYGYDLAGDLAYDFEKSVCVKWVNETGRFACVFMPDKIGIAMAQDNLQRLQMIIQLLREILTVDKELVWHGAWLVGK